MNSSSSSLASEKLKRIPALDSSLYSGAAITRVVATLALLGLLAYAAVRTLAYATVKPFWIDEVLTQTISRVGNFSAIVKVLHEGIDGQPPFYYLIERIAGSLFNGTDLAYRIPSILGFLFTIMFLYVFVKKRNGVVPAVFSATILLTTQLFTYYAAEARPYSLLTSCVALAMVCYQRAGSFPWIAGLFVSLLLACSLHFYGFAELLPFALAELTIVYLKKEIRLGVWLALIVAPLPLVLSLPLLLRMKESWGAHFWNQSYLGPGYSTFFSVFFTAFFRGTGRYWGTSLAGITVIVVLASFFPMAEGNRREHSWASSVAERVLILGLIVVPMVGYSFGRIGHIAFVNRYFLPCILGIAAAAGYFFARAKPPILLFGAIVLLSLIGMQEKEFWLHRHQIKPAEQFVSLAESARRDDLSIVVSDLAAYVEFWHSLSPSIRSRMVAFADPGNAVLYCGTDTVDRIALVLRSHLPIRLSEFSHFVIEHPVFLLYSNRSVGDWWPERLRHDGYHLHLLIQSGNNSIYLVETKAAT